MAQRYPRSYPEPLPLSHRAAFRPRRAAKVFIFLSCRDSSAGRVLADQNARACRRTERARGVGLREPSAALGETINVWCLVEGAAETGQVMRP